MKEAPIFLGILFLSSGFIVLKNKKVGLEDGNRVIPPIRGKSAIFFGIVFVLIGIALILVGALAK